MPTADLSQPAAVPRSFLLPALCQGHSGSAVRVLQQLLNFQGFSLEVDGQFGPHTREAVKQFQYINNLSVDGIVNAETWHCLGCELLPFAF